MTDVDLPCRNTVNESLLLLLLVLLLLLKNNRNDFLKSVHGKYREGKLLKDAFSSVYFFLSYIARKKIII